MKVDCHFLHLPFNIHAVENIKTISVIMTTVQFTPLLMYPNNIKHPYTFYLPYFGTTILMHEVTTT